MPKSFIIIEVDEDLKEIVKDAIRKILRFLPYIRLLMTERRKESAMTLL
jgi:hypothetical protein